MFTAILVINASAIEKPVLWSYKKPVKQVPVLGKKPLSADSAL